MGKLPWTGAFKNLYKNNIKTDLMKIFVEWKKKKKSNHVKLTLKLKVPWSTPGVKNKISIKRESIYSWSHWVEFPIKYSCFNMKFLKLYPFLFLANTSSWYFFPLRCWLLQCNAASLRPFWNLKYFHHIISKLNFVNF